MNMGLPLRSCQRSKRSPKLMPRYTLMPQMSMSGIAASVAASGNSPYTLITGWSGSGEGRAQLGARAGRGAGGEHEGREGRAGEPAKEHASVECTRKAPARPERAVALVRVENSALVPTMYRGAVRVRPCS